MRAFDLEPSAMGPGLTRIELPQSAANEAATIAQTYLSRAADAPKGLHLGCGQHVFPGWLNIDVGGRPDIVWDLKRPLDFLPDDCMDFVHSEHFFEHFNRRDMEKICADLRRAMRPGGIMRVGVPDLDEIVRQYSAEDESFFRAACQGFGDYYGRQYFTKGEFMDVAFRQWGHRYLYNFEDLARLLTAAGFTAIERVAISASKHEFLRGLERRPREQTSLVVEAVNPR